MHTVKLTLGALVTCLMLTGCLDVTTEDKEKTPQIKAFADTFEVHYGYQFGVDDNLTSKDKPLPPMPSLTKGLPMGITLARLQVWASVVWEEKEKPHVWVDTKAKRVVVRTCLGGCLIEEWEWLMGNKEANLILLDRAEDGKGEAGA
tara:strand:- start:475 stop:915 length:441 start_codon:yes stop_codon:yes gene_type:complete